MSLVEHVASRETKPGDIEGIDHYCGCGRVATLVPTEWDTSDWAKVVCPECFTEEWKRIYE